MKFEDWIKTKDADCKAGLDSWSARKGWEAAINAVLAEWEKPYGLTDGRKFIDRLRDMSNAELRRAAIGANINNDA